MNIKVLIASLIFLGLLVGCIALVYAQQCYTYTINTADGRLIACYVCGGIITCN
jgi:hypothetical protein